jgi:RNA polymerase sigma-70 factor (ECF subfamily)
MQACAEPFEAMVEATRSRVYRAACLLLDDPHEAEDVTQRVFVEAWRGWDRFEGRSDVFTWLYTILRRVCARQRRRRGWAWLMGPRWPDAGAIENEPDPGNTPDESLAVRDDNAGVRRLLGRLSPKLREVLVLRYIEDYTVPEIARALRVPEGTVKSRLNYALQRAAATWDGGGADER